MQAHCRRLAGAGQGAGEGTVPVVPVVTVVTEVTLSLSLPAWQGWVRLRDLLGAGTAACLRAGLSQQHITTHSWPFPGCSCLFRPGKYNNLLEKGLGAPAAPAGRGLGWFSFPPPHLSDFCFPVDSCLKLLCALVSALSP